MASARCAKPSIHALRIPRKHLDDVIVQAIVELFLECPRELRMLNFARVKLESIVVHFRVGRFVADLDLYAAFRRPRFEIKKRVLVVRELMPHFICEQFAHLKLFACNSVHTLAKLASASLSKRTKDIFSTEVGCSKCLATSRNMISAHSRSGNSAIPAPTAGNAMVFSPFCAAIRNECAVELRKECADVFPPSCMLAACIT